MNGTAILGPPSRQLMCSTTVLQTAIRLASTISPLIVDTICYHNVTLPPLLTKSLHTLPFILLSLYWRDPSTSTAHIRDNMFPRPPPHCVEFKLLSSSVRSAASHRSIHGPIFRAAISISLGTNTNYTTSIYARLWHVYSRNVAPSVRPDTRRSGLACMFGSLTMW